MSALSEHDAYGHGGPSAGGVQSPYCFTGYWEDNVDSPLWETYMQDWGNFFAQLIENWEAKALFAGFTTWINTFFGANTKMVAILFIVIIMDFVLGIISALRYNGHLSSRRLHGGVLKMFMYALTLIFVLLLQDALYEATGINLTFLLPFYALYQICTEASSVTRHLLRLGFPVPKGFAKILGGAERRADGKLSELLDIIGSDNGKSEVSDKDIEAFVKTEDGTTCIALTEEELAALRRGIEEKSGVRVTIPEAKHNI